MKSIATLVICALVAGCSHLSPPPKTALRNNNFNSTLWMQNASEFKANAHQTYNIATKNIDRLIKADTESVTIDSRSPTLPLAIIFDVDETVLDNSEYNAKLILNNNEYSPETWDHWVSLQQASPVPGAIDFIHYAEAKGVEVFFITNRECIKREGILETCPQKTDTIKNLQKVGLVNLNYSNLLLKNEQENWSSEKESRRQFIAKKYHVIMNIGDDLGDFISHVKKGITPGERAGLVTTHQDKWGSTWYILPNPKYGSWLNILQNPQVQYLRGY